MAPSRKKSRKLGLEEEASSSEEAKKMYVFVSHDGWDYGYSLFALGIPSSGTIVKTKPTVVSVKGVKSKIASRSEPERSPVLPILRFRQGDGWTSGMRCIRLGQKLYFLGGDYSHYLDIEEVDHEKIYPNQVYALDLSQEVNWRHRNHARKVVEQVASMNTGKDGFIVSFVADGKIFLVASGNKTKELVQFEIFSPSEGLWTIGARPPFGHHAYLCPPLVLGRKVYFYGHFGGFNGRFTCCYTIDDGSWSDYRVTKEDYDDDGRWSDYRVTKEDGFINFGDFKCTRNDFSLMVGGVVVGESTVWNVCGQKVPAVVRLDITKEKQVEKKYFSSGLMYYIQPPAPADADADAIAPDPIGTSLAAVAEDSRRLCFLQVDDGGLDPTRMSVILFDRAGGESPEYLTSAHYFVKMDSYNPTYRLIDAHIV